MKIATVNIQKQLETFQSIFKSHGHREVMLQGDRTGLFISEALLQHGEINCIRNEKEMYFIYYFSVVLQYFGLNLSLHS